MKTIGVITKTYGFEGAVVVKSESGRLREPETGEPVFIVIDGIPVPFFTREAFLSAPDTLVISFDDYPTEKSVLRFKGCEVRCEKGENDVNDIDYTGYTIEDAVSGFRGVIISLTELPGQLLASVKSGNENVLIPLHPDLVIKTDKREKTIIMSLPPGLTGIND